MKILVLTTQPEWDTWHEKILACQGGIEISRNLGETYITIERYRYAQPRTVEGKIDRAWFNKLTIEAKKRGYQAVVLHFSRAEGKRWGIKDGLRGSTINDEVMGEMWLCADEDDLITYPSGRKVNRFVKVFLHECSHWFAKRLLATEDKTHYWDYERENIALAFTEYTFPLGILDKIANSFVKERLTLPLHEKYWNAQHISMAWAVESDLYQSGIHNGVDFAVPVGTPIYAPADGKIVKTWDNDKTAGNGLVYHFYYQGRLRSIRCLHLKKEPTQKSYRRGRVIGYTGNTGTSTGPHVHMELWKGGYDRNVLYSREAVLDTLSNPYLFFRSLAT